MHASVVTMIIRHHTHIAYIQWFRTTLYPCKDVLDFWDDFSFTKTLSDAYFLNY